MPGKEEKIALLDFGIIGKLTPMLRAEIVKLFIALNEKDIEGIITAMMHMNMVAKDDEEIRRDMRNMLGPYYGAGLNKIDFPKLFYQSIKVARKHKIKVSRDYVLLAKAVLTIESVCVGLYPQFNFVEQSKPFVTRLTLHEYSPKKFIAESFMKFESAKRFALELPNTVSTMIARNEANDRKIAEISTHLDNAEQRMDVLIEKMIFMFATLVMTVAGFILMKKEPLFDGLSIYSIIAFCIAAGTFLVAVFLTKRRM
jgi:ubiquinone biosynthesis protein